VLVQRSPEWYEKRKTRITASEVASILGENPYEGAADVALRKKGLGKPFTGNIATRYGQAHESAAIAAYCAALGAATLAGPGRRVVADGVAALARAADAIGETEEFARCVDLLDDCDPAARSEFGLG
jgi:hypothetical protein